MSAPANDGRRLDRVDLQELLAHADWVRGVALELVGCASAADDIVQSTWTAALERPPRERHDLRAWLAQVVRNQARQTGRSSGRRSRRERAAARPEAQPSTAELVERAALSREVAGHVLALDEPFREVVLLRFFEDLNPPAIARRLDVPLKTVHSRLARAFEKLRARMDSEYGGDRKSWCLALAPLAAWQQAAPLPPSFLSPLGGLLVNTNLKLGLAAGIVLLGGIGVWQLVATQAGGRSVEPAERGVSARDVLSSSKPNEVTGRDIVPERVSVADPQAIPAAVEATPGSSVLARGRAVDVSGRPLAGVAIAIAGSVGEPDATTNADGTFEVAVAGRGHALWQLTSRICLEVVDTRWVTLRQSCISQTSLDLEHLVVAAPVRSIAGRVVDQDAVAIEGARVALAYQADTFFGFPYRLDLTSQVAFGARTDATGDFIIERFPDAEGLSVYVTATNYQQRTFVLDDESSPFVFELTRVEDVAGTWIQGIVLDHRGAHVAGAKVQLADASTRSVDDGSFRLRCDHTAPETPLCASVKGSLPALLPDFGKRLARADGPLEPVQLVLGGPPLGISGQVIDIAGEPCVGWTVALVDATAVSQYTIPVKTAEQLARNRDVETDDNGHFVLTGLYPRDYRVQAYDKRTLLRTEAVLRAGQDSAVLVAEAELVGPVHGRVIDLRGLPVPDVRVTLSIVTVRTSFGHSGASGASLVTGADGSFVFEEVPSEEAYLSFSGQGILPGSYELAGQSRDLLDETHELTVVKRCHFRIELSQPGDADQVAFLDADGERLQVTRFEAHGMSGFSFATLKDGRSETLSVSELATTAVLMRQGVETARHQISLDPDNVNVLSL